MSQDRVVELVAALYGAPPAGEASARVARSLSGEVDVRRVVDALVLGLEKVRALPRPRAGLALFASTTFAAIFGAAGLRAIADVLDRPAAFAAAPLAGLVLAGFGIVASLGRAQSRRSDEAILYAELLAAAGLSTAKAIDVALYVSGSSPDEVRWTLADRAPEGEVDPVRIGMVFAASRVGEARGGPRRWYAAGAVLAVMGFWIAYATLLGAAARAGAP